jgi:hypothetical protein
MKNRSSRRMFLRGAAGFTLAIPFLQSLLPRGAQAQVGADGRRRFVAFATEHGGVWQPDMYPADATLTQTTNYAGAARRRGDLALQVNGGVASLSPVLSASSSVFTAAIAAKMNVVRGFDVPFYLAHHRGGHLGNYANNDANGVDGGTMQSRPRPTIDQVMAWSNGFYPDLATIRERSLVIGGQGMSAGWSSPSTASGTIQNLAPSNDSLALFDAIFIPEDPNPRPAIVDRVHADYQRLRQNPRLSSGDRRRLDDHLDRIDELQRKINVVVSCGDIDRPQRSSIQEWGESNYGVNPEAHARFWQLMNDVVAVAFSCDTSRIATLRVTDIFSDFVGDWHDAVAHQATQPDGVAQQILATAHQRFFQNVFMDLVAKLDAIDVGEGETLLDSTLVQWTQECGAVTHDPIELPIITAGGVNGFFRTGSYVDYRDLGRRASQPSEGNAVTSHVGLVYNQWLGTVLEAMGVPREDFETGSHGGYGEVILSTETWYSGYQKYDTQLNVMGEVPPFLRA